MKNAGLQTFRYKAENGARAIRRFVVPYVQSRFHASEFRPILGYLYTEWKCNVDCHYCWQFNNTKKGITLEKAKESIDFLKSNGCRVLALMGGEPLIRRKLILDVIRYGVENGFFVYLPTNGRLLTEELIDDLGQTGVATINLAIDCMKEKEGLPKALNRIRPQFEYLVKQQEEHGYIVFLNINITSKNLKDVIQITDLAKSYHIATDYHINEPPYLEQPHYRHKNTDTYIREEHWDEVDIVLDELIARNKAGYTMVNSIAHLESMKKFIRGGVVEWECRAGHNSIFIRDDGGLAPCFAMYNADKDWGNISDGYNMDLDDLDRMKEDCTKHCNSTCQFNLGYYSKFSFRTLRWALKHVSNGGLVEAEADN